MKPERNLNDTYQKLFDTPDFSRKLLLDYCYNIIQPLLDSFDRGYTRLVEHSAVKTLKGLPREKKLDSSSVKMANGKSFLDLAIEVSTLTGTLSRVSSGVDLLASSLLTYSVKKSIEDFIETNSLLSGSAGLYLGVDENNKVSFISPKSSTGFYDLSDVAPDAHAPAALFKGAAGALSVAREIDLLSLNEVSLTATQLVETVTLGGSQLDGAFLLLDIGLMANTTDYTVILNPAYNGSIIVVKVIAGEETGSAKKIVGGGGATIEDGAVASLPLMPDKGYVLCYNESRQTFIKLEEV